jgi:hypothetical protein
MILERKRGVMLERFFRRKIIVQPDSLGRTSPEVPYHPNNFFLEQWENRGRLALALGFLPHDSLETITGYKEPSELLRHLYELPRTERVLMLTNLAVADQMLFGGALRERNITLLDQYKIIGKAALFRLEAWRYVPALIEGDKDSSRYQAALSWWKGVEKMGGDI